MLEGFEDFELAPVIRAIRTYEGISGLLAQYIRHDSDGLQIEWAYPDGVWAGTTCYEMPLARTVEKLEHQIELADMAGRAVA